LRQRNLGISSEDLLSKRLASININISGGIFTQDEAIEEIGNGLIDKLKFNERLA
jgi:hypothetical protein